jgi:hypothetical protein
MSKLVTSSVAHPSSLVDNLVLNADGSIALDSVPAAIQSAIDASETTDASALTSGTLAAARLPAGTVLNVVSTAKTDKFTTSSASFVEITGLNATITPTSTSSKILIIAQITHSIGGNSLGYGHFKVTRAGSDIYLGNASGSQVRAVFGGVSQTVLGQAAIASSIAFLHSPNSTSAMTYRVEGRASDGPVHVNRSQGDTNNTNNVAGASSITLIEVAG